MVHDQNIIFVLLVYTINIWQHIKRIKSFEQSRVVEWRHMLFVYIYWGEVKRFSCIPVGVAKHNFHVIQQTNPSNHPLTSIKYRKCLVKRQCYKPTLHAWVLYIKEMNHQSCVDYSICTGQRVYTWPWITFRRLPRTTDTIMGHDAFLFKIIELPFYGQP